jgi:preprotein translocase subunit SecD
MTFRLNRFNPYLRSAALACVLVLALVCGCQTPKRKKAHAVTTLQVHLECSPYETDRNQFISIPREHPTKIAVEKESFLTEANVTGAKVISEMDGFVINLQLDHRGKLVLEEYTAGNRGHRLAIYCQFGQNLSTNRWLAAPLISHVIKDGSLTFTPDASRDEADQIVLGLNNVAKKVQERDQ